MLASGDAVAVTLTASVLLLRRDVFGHACFGPWQQWVKTDSSPEACSPSPVVLAGIGMTFRSGPFVLYALITASACQDVLLFQALTHVHARQLHRPV